MSFPAIVIVEKHGCDNVPLFDFPLKHVSSGENLTRKPSTVVTEITDFEDAAYREESTIPPGCLPKGCEQSIDLSQRHLETFPVKVFAICKQLTYLFLQENLLKSLPEELFTTFPLLRRLDVRRNRLTSIPAIIGDHPALEVLLLQDNEIVALPPHLGHCQTLRNLQLQNNPLKWPDESIVRQGIETLLAHLRDNDKSDDVLNENRQSSQMEGYRLEEFECGSGDSRRQSENVVLPRQGSPFTEYLVQKPQTMLFLRKTGMNFKEWGESKTSCTKGPRSTSTKKSNSKTSLRRKSSASFDDEDQATVICRRGQFPLGYQKRLSYVPPNQVYESLRRELWKDILRRELLLQDYLLQKRRDSETLKQWRQKTRLMQLLPKGERESTIVPFDQDDSLQMMTWRELLQARNQTLEKKGHSKPGPLARRDPDPTEGILKLLQDIDRLKEDSTKVAEHPDELSQHQYRINLSTQIKKLRELQKALRSIRIV